MCSLRWIDSLEYLAVKLRATNRGKWDMLALVAVAFPRIPGSLQRRALLIRRGVVELQRQVEL